MAFLQLEINEQGVGLLRIERPEALNALNEALLKELDEVLTRVDQSEAVKVLVVTGSGRAFVAGADILAMSVLEPAEAEQFSHLGQRILSKLAALKQPTIAAINGFALGGGLELALACDLRLASDRAKVGQPEIGLGIIPGFGGTQRLARLLGSAKAKEIMYTGRTFAADEALAMGLVNAVTTTDDLLPEAMALAASIAKHSAPILNNLKKAIDQGADLPLDRGLALEAEHFSACFATHDQKEGMAAFLEKRNPRFLDR